MKSKLLQILTEQYEKTGKHNGLRTSDICEKLGCDYREIRQALNELHAQNKIEIINTINFRAIRIIDEYRRESPTEIREV